VSDPATATDRSPVEGPPRASGIASVTLEDVQQDPELSLYISSADRVMDAMGYTEHGFRHANLVAKIAYQVLHRLGFGERDAQLACVAGLPPRRRERLARDAHDRPAPVLVSQALRERAEGADLMRSWPRSRTTRRPRGWRSRRSPPR